MKREFTLIKNDKTLPKLPHNNKNNHNIFTNSNITSIKSHSDFSFTLNKEARISYLTNQFTLQKNSQRLKANNQELRIALESANIMAHNLKSPLMALQLLLKNEGISDSNKSLIQLALNKIQKTANNIQLLDTAYGACQKNRKHYKVEINSFINECFDEISFMYEQDKNVIFKLNLSKDLLESKICTALFKDALYNIIKNSYESIEHSGVIEVSTRCKHDTIEIRISDTGKGIPQQLIKKIGNKKMTYGKRGGTGIGLYHVKKVMSDLKGKLNIRSIEGLGTQVSLFIQKTNYYS